MTNSTAAATIAKVQARDVASHSYTTNCISALSSYDVCDDWTSITSSTPCLENRVDKIEQQIKKPDVDPIVKTNMVFKNGSIYVKHYKDGFFKKERHLMSDIVDVRVYDNTVVVMFADKTKTSAVLDSVDTFSLEQGISICITKKLLGEDGNSLYNKLITRALKVIKKKQKVDEDAKKKKEADKRACELKKARAERRKAKKREDTINIQAEAIKRAFASIVGSKFAGV
jgi:hypothetical protein